MVAVAEAAAVTGAQCPAGMEAAEAWPPADEGAASLKAAAAAPVYRADTDWMVKSPCAAAPALDVTNLGTDGTLGNRLAETAASLVGLQAANGALAYSVLE